MKALTWSTAAVLVLTSSIAGAQTPTKLGPVFTVATEAIEFPKIGVDSDGDFMVVWRGDGAGADDIRGRIYDSAGAPIAASFVVQDPGLQAEDAFNSWDGIQDVASDGSGGFVVVFNAEGGGYAACDYGPCVFSRRYEDTGAAGTQFLVQGTTYPTFQAGNPEIAQNDAGDFIVAWEALESTYYYATTQSEDVFGRVLGNDGSVASAKFQANETFYYYQSDGGRLDVAGGPGGSFVVAWHDEYEGAGFRRFSSAGTPTSSEAFAIGDAASPDDEQVAYESGGNVLLVWISDGDLEGRVYDPTGTPLGAEFTITSAIPYDADPAIAGFPSDHFIVVWRTGSEIRGQRLDGTGSAVGPSFEVTSADGADPDVDTDADGNFVVVWKSGTFQSGYEVLGQRFAKPDLLPFPVFSKKLKLKDKVPDAPEKRKAQWVVKDPSIALPDPGTAGDPSCNGDPSGTVKASIRFWSTDSGHDTGAIDLPCQWWFSFGSGSKLSYQYKDLKLFDSPCKFIKLKTGQQIRATCLAKNPAFPIDYDLEVGTPEGTVHTTLVMGDRLFCSSTPTFKTKDGSDGRLFLGKDGAAPATCL